MNYLKMLVDEFHSTVVATIGSDGNPQTRVIDMMLYDENSIYFLTAKGKAFYAQLMEQRYIALSAVKDKRSVSLRGKVRNIGNNKLNEIFEANTYMQKIYPNDTRSALEVFQIYDAQGEYFDISEPSKIIRESFAVGDIKAMSSGYFIGNNCIVCKQCVDVCPQNCIEVDKTNAVINQRHCLHCGRCAEICPVNAITKVAR